MALLAVLVTLTAAERKALNKRIRGTRTAGRDRLRAQVVLAAARGRSNARIADVNYPTSRADGVTALRSPNAPASGVSVHRDRAGRVQPGRRRYPEPTSIIRRQRASSIASLVSRYLGTPLQPGG